jgi:curved DNA-binding protein CbpA
MWALRRFFLVLCLTQLVWGYEWDNWNYYELLGINESEVDDKTIKQAYRREARTWHPDKHQNSNVSKEEATERFRRIAEAYEVLSDPEQRSLYRSYLKEQTNTPNGRTREASSSSAYTTATDNAAAWNNFFSWETFRDPFKVFEEFFFTQEDDEEFDNAWWFHNAASDPLWNGSADPERTFYYDPLLGQVLRVIQRDYDPESASHMIRYQDYVEDWDPHWRTWGWYPIQSEPIFVRPRNNLERPLVPPAFLQFGHFVAGIFENCQLQIRRGTTIIWQATELEENFNRGEMCYLALQGSQLTVQMNTRILWSTPMCPQEIEWRQNRQRRSLPHFEARLDEGGSLTVYHTPRQRPQDGWALLEQMKTLFWKEPGCCYSTNPAGCYRIGRIIVRLMTFNHRLEGILVKVATYFHLFLDWLEDDDSV